MQEKWYSTRNTRMLERQKQLRIQEAAPALLEALESLSKEYAKLSDSNGLNPCASGVYRNARAAIAAARGEV